MLLNKAYNEMKDDLQREINTTIYEAIEHMFEDVGFDARRYQTQFGYQPTRIFISPRDRKSVLSVTFQALPHDKLSAVVSKVIYFGKIRYAEIPEYETVIQNSTECLYDFLEEIVEEMLKRRDDNHED